MREQRNNSGVLFRDHDKKNDRGPDYTGTANIEGTTYRMAAWIKTAKNGSKFMSFAFSEQTDRPAPKDASPPNAGEDDIAF